MKSTDRDRLIVMGIIAVVLAVMLALVVAGCGRTAGGDVKTPAEINVKAGDFAKMQQDVSSLVTTLNTVVNRTQSLEARVAEVAGDFSQQQFRPVRAPVDTDAGHGRYRHRPLSDRPAPATAAEPGVGDGSNGVGRGNGRAARPAGRNPPTRAEIAMSYVLVALVGIIAGAVAWAIVWNNRKKILGKTIAQLQEQLDKARGVEPVDKDKP